MKKTHPTFALLSLLVVTSLIIAACSGDRTSTTSSQQSATASGASALRSIQSGAKLGSYNINPSKVFVAGISSGGFFAVQMHVAHSSTFKGAAIYAGGVYWCPGTGGVNQALNDCGGSGQYASTLAASESYLDQQSSAGTIDPKSNLSGSLVYLWSGTQDGTVKQAEMNDLQTEYQHYGANVFQYDNNYAANHGWESPKGEVPCGSAYVPYMIDCNNYDSEQTWLTKFIGPLNAKNTGTLGGTLINFDQTEFGAAASNSLDTNGYVYVPKNCANGQSCSFVLALHGCLQYQAIIQTKFITESGINEWADTNNVVVMYPYAIASQSNPSNGNGCWDWWGYDDANYSLKSGTQIAIVYKMVQRVMGGTQATPTPTPAPTGPTPTPSPTPHSTPTPTPAPTQTPTPFCTTAANYYHVQAGRAHDSGGYALANGSNQNMGLDNVFYQTTLKQTGPNYYVIGCT